MTFLQKIDIWKLGVSFLVPISIFVMGFILTKKIEDIKAQSAKRYYWDNKISDTFYTKFQIYIEEVSEFITNAQFLLLKVNKKTQNDSEGISLQNNMNSTAKSIFMTGNELKIYSYSLFKESDIVNNQIEKVYNLISDLMNIKAGNPEDIYKELKILNDIIRTAYNQQQKE